MVDSQTSALELLHQQQMTSLQVTSFITDTQQHDMSSYNALKLKLD